MDNVTNKKGDGIGMLFLKIIGVIAFIAFVWWLIGMVVMMGNAMGYIPDSVYNTLEPILYHWNW